MYDTSEESLSSSSALGSRVGNCTQNRTLPKCHFPGGFNFFFNRIFRHSTDFVFWPKMFSKLLRGKSETALFALKQQWEMEFQKANRKFQKLKVHGLSQGEDMRSWRPQLRRYIPSIALHLLAIAWQMNRILK